MKINENTSVVDVALNLSGSLAGLPVVVEQLPVGELVGFDAIPAPGEDVADIGQTWTPDLQGKEVELDVPVYNPSAQQKEPYTTNMSEIAPVISDGESWMNALLPNPTRIRLADLPIGFNLRGCKLVFTMTHLRPTPGIGASYYGLITDHNSAKNSYIGEIIGHYAVNNPTANSIVVYPGYVFATDASEGRIDMYSNSRGWIRTEYQFSDLRDSFIRVNITLNDAFEPGYWNWNYAYVELPQLANPRKKVCDIPVGFNLRGKTVYFQNAQLEADLQPDKSFNLLASGSESGETYAIALYSKEVANRYSIRIEEYSKPPILNVYDSFKGAFIATKYTFPDTEDIIVTSNNLPATTSKWKWGFDYAEISDDSTLPAPPIIDIVRPYYVWKNLAPCTLDGWVNWVASATPPAIQGGGAIKFTTNGEANSYNGGGIWTGLGRFAQTGDIINASFQVNSAEIRGVQLGLGAGVGSVGGSIKATVERTGRYYTVKGSPAIPTEGYADGVFIAKQYADAVPGTYLIQNVVIEIYKVAPNANKSNKAYDETVIYGWADAD